MAASSNKLKTSDDATVRCDLCLFSEKDKFSYGEFYVRDSVSVKYFWVKFIKLNIISVYDFNFRATTFAY